MHNYWGVRLKDGTKRVLGRSRCNTTKIGKRTSRCKREEYVN